MTIRCSRFAPLIVSAALGASLGACVQPSSRAPIVGSAAAGASAVTVLGCKGCHEPDLGGNVVAFHDDTTYLPDTISYASNLTADVATGLGGWTDVQIDVAIRVGVDGVEKPMCEPMPVYADMSDQEVADIIAYLRSLPAVVRAIDESSCPSQHGAPHKE